MRRIPAPVTARRTLLSLACLAAANGAAAQPAAPAAPASAASQPAPAVQFEADSVRGRLNQDTVMQGHVVLRRDPLTIAADQIEYSPSNSIARARGAVRVQQRGDVYTGSFMQVDIDRFEGFVLDPTYRFERTQAGGHAQRIDFLGQNKMTVNAATYTSCPAPQPGDEDQDLPWELSAKHLRLDFDSNEGVAENAVVRFYGVPILGAPTLSFSITGERKSGWLPPIVDLSNTHGFEIAAPYYWNIAPNLDATLTPGLSTRRGAALTTELRYLEPRWRGEAAVFSMPDDRVTQRSRWAGHWVQEGHLPADTHYDWQWSRVSDDEFWKDGLRDSDSLTPRLLPEFAQVQRRGSLHLGGMDLGRTLWYARVQRWQSLQDPDPTARFDAPYRREPQLGMRYEAERSGFDLNLTTELNRFTHENSSFVQGTRAHVLASLARPFGDSGWMITPRLSVNAAGYDMDRPLPDGRTRAKRAVGTFSLDSAWTFERDAVWRGRAVTQTLEPRLLYVRTPYVDQNALPNFDSAGVDFNATTVFTENAFSGVDRVSDARQVTAGLTTRLIDVETGAESARFGIAQRYLLRDQQLTPDGPPLTRQFSDILLLGSTTAIEHWTLDGSLQYSPEIDRLERSIASVRYSPGPFRTVNATYRSLRGSNEQVEFGWQWPTEWLQNLVRPRRSDDRCSGALYSVGRIDYNLRDKRNTDSILGFEYDSGCWVGRIVAQRQSTGVSDATNKLSVQLELVGLSRLAVGSNPLRLLKDNIPGYQLLRDDTKPAVGTTPAAVRGSSPSSAP